MVVVGITSGKNISINPRHVVWVEHQTSATQPKKSFYTVHLVGGYSFNVNKAAYEKVLSSVDDVNYGIRRGEHYT